ncbi:TetR/AcrR family transcriptional regulator [Yimella sp. cx-573]|nr:TetR/AcrR family transcriptional regulator [Yimella sp. cx-573]
MSSQNQPLDGRDTRWTTHRVQRRRQLVEAAIKAIRKHGATVGMDEIAATAGTSKTVIYRHLGDRLGLYLAVCEAVDSLILKDFDIALTSGVDPHDPTALLSTDPHDVLVAVIDSYLSLVEDDPELYRFVIRRPLVDVPPEADPVAGLTDAIAGRLSDIFAAALSAAGRDTAPATTWGHALVGYVREAADRWLADPQRAPREAVVQHLAEFASVGLTGVLGTPAPHQSRTSITHPSALRTTNDRSST